ncbi:MAG: ImmA/IrrE family metallo-endopeptidase [Verrucomicrobia bacterium]|jgi:hypothetical protein|nr:ImmA/IrrE family metallo-endopeptidase [Verrucomicrobiota bacterium]
MVQLPARPVLTWQQIAAIASAFTEDHGLAQREYPLDVEAIAEFDLDIEIRTAAGILETCGMPAQIGPGGQRPIMIVDAEQWRHQTSFYRFSVAHEIGHYVLHRKWLEKVWSLYDSIESWKQVIASRSESDYGWLEAQADEFASYLLAPEQVFDPLLETQLALLEGSAGTLQAEDIIPYLANPIGSHFGMSNAAAQARIRKSPRWQSFADELPTKRD